MPEKFRVGSDASSLHCELSFPSPQPKAGCLFGGVQSLRGPKAVLAHPAWRPPGSAAYRVHLAGGPVSSQMVYPEKTPSVWGRERVGGVHW